MIHVVVTILLRGVTGEAAKGEVEGVNEFVQGKCGVIDGTDGAIEDTVEVIDIKGVGEDMEKLSVTVVERRASGQSRINIIFRASNSTAPEFYSIIV